MNEYNVTLYLLGDVCLVSLKIYAQMHGQTGVKPGIKPLQRFNIGYIRRYKGSTKAENLRSAKVGVSLSGRRKQKEQGNLQPQHNKGSSTATCKPNTYIQIVLPFHYIPHCNTHSIATPACIRTCISRSLHDHQYSCSPTRT